jgi:AcrR family transcriptional regulator
MNSGRENSRDSILDAAERLIGRVGASHFTIDGVAAECGLSKGGVLYNFPTKLALIQAMIDRAVDRTESEMTTAISAAHRHGANLEAMLRSMIAFRPSAKNTSMGLLAAVAEEPSLIEGARKYSLRMEKQLLETLGDQTLVDLLMLVGNGCHFEHLLQLRDRGSEQESRLISYLVDLVQQRQSSAV